mgnify:CR=1 FL=1
MEGEHAGLQQRLAVAGQQGLACKTAQAAAQAVRDDVQRLEQRLECTLLDRSVMAIAVTGFSVPVFVVGYLLVYLFAIELKWLPVPGWTPCLPGCSRPLVIPG